MMSIATAGQRLLAQTAAGIAGCVLSVSALGAGYVGTVLPTFGGLQTIPWNIDSAGAVTGWSSQANYAQRAFLWKNGQMTDLGLVSVNGSTGVTGHESNAAGQVVGAVSGGSSGGYFRYANGVMSVLPGFDNYGYISINQAGDIAGQNSLGQILLYRGGTVANLGSFGRASATSSAINNAGAIVGYVNDSSGANRRGFVWKDGVATIIQPLAGNYSDALDINDSGDVVGLTSIASDPNGRYVYVRRNGVTTNTGILEYNASGRYGINNVGHVVAPNGVYINGTFTPVASMLPPNLAVGVHDGYYWTFPTLTSINDAGQVSGHINYFSPSTYASGTVGFVLTPAAICTP